MKSVGCTYKSNIVLNKEQHNTVIHEIEIVNFLRFKILLSILIVIQIMFIVFNDLKPYIIPSAHTIWMDYRYFVVHLFLLSFSMIGLIIVKRLLKSDIGERKRPYRYFTPVLLVVYLVLISFLNGLDMINIKYISSLFIANLLICGGIFIINFPKNLITYAIPFLCYIGTFIYFGFSSDILLSNLINGLIFYFAVIIISTTIYKYQYAAIAENITLDITNDKLNYLSNHDPLTGLLNRRCFMEEIVKYQSEKSESATIVLADIDFFKDINDEYGHPVGDLVLTNVSSMIMKHIKDRNLAVRWGGEEFLLFLHNTSLEEAYMITDNLRKDLEQLIMQGKDYTIQITASFGLSNFINDSDISFHNAYKAADIALYQAKDQGRNRVVTDSTKKDGCVNTTKR